MANIGENIKKLRESAGLSQDQLGVRINKTRSAVSQYESGKIVPRMGVIEDLAHVFKVSKVDIIGDGRESADYEQRIVALARMMDEDGRARLMEQAEFLAERHSESR